MLSLALCLLSTLTAPEAGAALDPAPAGVAPLLQDKEEYQRRRKEAGDDVDKLWDLHLWCDAYGMDRESKSCLRRIVKLSPNHRKAHEALGHIEYDGKWFPSEKKVEDYKRDEEERIAKEQGLVRYEDRWVPAADVPFLERGMVRDDDGVWVSKEEYEKLKAGWTRQDLVWVSPEEKENVAKGLWKCGDDWKALPAANEYHARIGLWWSIPSDHYVLHATVDRAVAEKALAEMERAYKDFVRATGKAPERPLQVVLLRSAEQYGAFAAGDAGRPATESRGLSSVHYAYFAETWFDEELGFPAAGVAYWDATTDAGNLFGVHAARHAAGQSFMDAIDPSPKAVEKLVKGAGDGFVEDFWKEKQLPAWFRYGVAAYGERYFVDNLAEAGGNPYRFREWSISNILSQGGLQGLDEIFAFPITVDDPAGSAKLVNEVGLLIAFCLDGDCVPVKQAHAAVKDAIKTGDKVDKAMRGLEKALTKNEDELRKFAGM